MPQGCRARPEPEPPSPFSWAAHSPPPAGTLDGPKGLPKDRQSRCPPQSQAPTFPGPAVGAVPRKGRAKCWLQAQGRWDLTASRAGPGQGGQLICWCCHCFQALLLTTAFSLRASRASISAVAPAQTQLRSRSHLCSTQCQAGGSPAQRLQKQKLQGLRTC